MDGRSESNLAHVHPDLCHVVRRAAEIGPRTFIVIHGLRTPDEERRMVNNGVSQTMHSRHLPNKQGYACAVDIAAFDAGHISWEPKFYAGVWTQIQRAAAELNVPVEWGGNWTTLKDWGHFQLPWSDYP